jgi:D-alanine-D-alanine ligase
MKISAKDFGKVAVLFGGMSSEREVSLLSGEGVLEALINKGVDAHLIDVDFDIVQKLQELEPDRAFIALHGAYGEDGRVQGLLEMMNIPYTGCGVKASAIAMDKNFSKIIWKEYGLPVLPSFVATAKTPVDELEKALEKMGLPLCVKPVSNGSTIGVTKVVNRAELLPAYKNALQYDDFVLLEPWIEGFEFTVGILDDEALPPIEIVPDEEFYDYSAKYISHATRYLCPCNLSLVDQNKIKEIALKAFRILGCRHFARADFLQDKQGNFWLLELNTITGLTSHSLMPKAAKVAGIDYDTLIWKVLEFTLA